MNDNKASMTAIVSAFGRAYHSLFDTPKIFDDFLARQMLEDEEFIGISKHMSEGITFFDPQRSQTYSDPELALEWVVQTQIAPTPLGRSKYAEDMLNNAVMLGTKQYVILGAGLDTFAFRNKELLKEINVFEMDHPVTQQSKVNRIKKLGWKIPSSLKFLPINFNVDNFAECLVNGGFDIKQKSYFSWLGVSYYLTKQDIVRTLKMIAEISPKGSAVVFDYADGDIFNPDKTTRRVQNMVAMARSTGEPMLTGYTYSELEADLEKAGFLIYEHLTPVEIEKKYFSNRTDNYHAFENINYVLAVVK